MCIRDSAARGRGGCNAARPVGVFSKSVQHVQRGRADGAAALCQPSGRCGARPLRQGRDRGRRWAGAFQGHAECGHEPQVLRLAVWLRHRGGDPLAAVGPAGDAAYAHRRRAAVCGGCAVVT